VVLSALRQLVPTNVINKVASNGRLKDEVSMRQSITNLHLLRQAVSSLNSG